MVALMAKFVVPNSLGIHARPAALLVRAINRFDADIRVRNGGGFVNGKSLMEWMSLGAARGTVLTVSASGKDAVEAMDEIESLFKTSFYES